MGPIRPSFTPRVVMAGVPIRIPDAWKGGVQFALAITDAQNGEFLGGTGLNHINYQYRLANLGYWVRTSATGRGIATAAARLAGEFGVRCLRLLRAEIVVAVGNQPSLRVAEKVGAVKEGILRNGLTLNDGPNDVAIFSFIPEDMI